MDREMMAAASVPRMLREVGTKPHAPHRVDRISCARDAHPPSVDERYAGEFSPVLTYYPHGRFNEYAQARIPGLSKYAGSGWRCVVCHQLAPMTTTPVEIRRDSLAVERIAGFEMAYPRLGCHPAWADRTTVGWQLGGENFRQKEVGRERVAWTTPIEKLGTTDLRAVLPESQRRMFVECFVRVRAAHDLVIASELSGSGEEIERIARSWMQRIIGRRRIKSDELRVSNMLVGLDELIEGFFT